MPVRGRIVRWSSRGFGFVHIGDREGEAFVHLTAIKGDSWPMPADLVGQHVLCDITSTPRGLKVTRALLVEANGNC